MRLTQTASKLFFKLRHTTIYLVRKKRKMTKRKSQLVTVICKTPVQIAGVLQWSCESVSLSELGHAETL